MPGVDDQYVQARRVLLDALNALQQHLNAVILVGAQAIYLHTGSTEFAVAEFTTDADLALDPSILGTKPDLAQAMQAKGFVRQLDQPGVRRSRPDNIAVDLMVPEAVGGKGRRGARLEGHGEYAARKAKGLEAALVDKHEMDITALDPADSRSIRLFVAGPSALLVAKLHKLGDRQTRADRLSDKDAFDVYRLLKAISIEVFTHGFAALNGDSRSAEVTRHALKYLEDLFGTETALGTMMAARDVGMQEDHDFITVSCVELTRDLLLALQP